MTDLFPIYDLPTAREGILKRRAWAETEYPAALLQGVERIFGEPLTPEQAVSRVLADIRDRGEAALREWTARIDGFEMQAFRVPQDERQRALNELDPELRAALEKAAQRIADFHARQPAHSWLHVDEREGALGQIVRPLDSVGVYVPGGSAPLPSSLLMAAVVARVAGVETVIACSPPARNSGRIPDVILAAAEIAGVDALFAVGGAQAIAAMAFGAGDIPAVDKIVGPGGLFVTLAKRQVFGAVGIDGLPGPTETIVIADHQADPDRVAADLLAQAEHDVLATAILLTPSADLAQAVQIRVAERMEQLGRAETIAASLTTRGGAVITPDLDAAVEAANAYAAEHLCLSVADPWSLVPKIRHAGGIFVGEHSFEVLGDYIAGPSHIMPTEGTARFASPLNVEDFVKRISLIALNPESSAELSRIAARIAEAEGLDAHAAAARERVRDDADKKRG
ncbi:MAG: histidinol dehydrogenase [Chloroflexi bacterium]|nr:histidinol dehydrogenase [Chloroflexota bacterium]